MNPFKIIKRLKSLRALLSLTQTRQEAPLAKSKELITGVLAPLPENGVPLQVIFKANDVTCDTYKEAANRIATTGTTDGSQGIPAHGWEPCHKEEEIIAHHDHAVAEIEHLLLEPKATLASSIAAVTEELSHPEPLEHYQNKLEQRKRQRLVQAAKDIAHASWDKDLIVLIKKNRTVDGVMTGLKEQLKRLKEQKGNAETLYQNILANEYQRNPPLQKLIDRLGFFWIVVMGFAAIEVLVNLTSFQARGLGDNNIAALFLALIFAGGQAWAAKELGEAWHRKHKKQIQYSLIATGTFCLFMSGFRLNMEGVLMLKIVYMTINFIIAAGTVLLAYRHARHRDFFDIQRRRFSLSAKIRVKEYQLEEIEKNYKEACNTIEWETEAEARQQLRTAEKRLKKELTQLDAQQRRLEAHQTQCLGRLATIKQNALNRYRHLNLNARKECGHPAIEGWQQSAAKPNGQAQGIKASLSVLLLAVCCCLGCSYPPQQDNHIEVLYDQTGLTQTQDVDAMADYVLGYLQWDTLNSLWGETSIHFSPIGETSTQRLHSIKLEASELSWFKRNEYALRQQSKNFKTKVKQALAELARPTDEMDHSYIYRNLYDRMASLSKQEGNRIMLSWSDLILNGPEVNLYGYREHPDKIWEDKDSLIAAMTGQYPMPQVKGIRWINIHEATRLNDGLHENCKRLFRYHFEQHGMEVEFKTNTPGQRVVSANVVLTAQ